MLGDAPKKLALREFLGPKKMKHIRLSKRIGFCLMHGLVVLSASLACISRGMVVFGLDTLVESPTEVRAAAGSALTLGGTGDYHRSLANFVAGEGSRITLVGNTGTKFVINVSGNFEMTGAVLALEGGLLPADVLFNLNGTASGIRRRISGNSEFLGSIVAVGAPVTISNAAINGRKISGPIERAMIVPLRPPPRPRGPVGP